MARARRRYERPSGLDPLRVSRSHSARRSVAAACPHRAHRLERLEPYEGKLSSTVLRGGRAGNSPPPLDPWPVPISNPRSAPRRAGRTNLRSDDLRWWRSPPPCRSQELGRLGWDENDLEGRRKGHRVKVMLARRLRQETTMSLKWIAQRLQMGSWTYVSNLLNQPPQTQPQAQKELLVCQ
jgi:hypothetical protein